MTDQIVLAPLQSGELDDAMLTQVFRDIAQSAQLLSIMLKGGAETMAEAGPPTLDGALKLLRDRSVRAVQVRYIFENIEWWDTFIAGPINVKLLRSVAPSQG